MLTREVWQADMDKDARAMRARVLIERHYESTEAG